MPASPETQDLKVFITTGESTCSECGEELGRHAWIMLAGERGALCMACADLDHLVFLPAGVEHGIAAHACRKYSGRVGRSAAAKALDEPAVLLAVAAHVRHAQTGYVALLAAGVERHEARRRVQDRVDAVLAEWRGAK